MPTERVLAIIQLPLCPTENSHAFATWAGSLLVLSFVLLAGCKKKPAEDGKPSDVRIDVPDSTGTDALMVAHFRIGDIWNSHLLKETFDALAKTEEGKDTLEEMKKSAEKEIGFWPGDIDTITFMMPDFPDATGIKFAVILTSNKAFNKNTFMKSARKGSTQRQSFIAMAEGKLLHFPDDKTVVVMHDSMADKYLAGYAKDKSGWPMSDGLKKAAEGHALLISLNAAKIPAEARGDPALRQFDALLSCKTATLVGDLKGKEIVLGLRGSFPDDASAKKAQELVSQKVKEVASMVGKVLEEPNAQKDLGAALVLVKEAKRALNEMSIATSGSELTVKASYRADFNVGEVMADAVKKVRIAAERSKGQNNLKQIGIAIHNYADTSSDGTSLVISGTNAKGQPIKSLDEKPLLSWRVALLPYIEEGPLYQQFKQDEPWDSEHNKKLIAKMPKIYGPPKGVTAPEGKTYLQMVIGPKAMRPGFKISTIPDGTSNTIAIVEAAEPVIWTRPDDVFIPGKEMPKDLKKKFGGHFKNGFNVAMFDGSVRWIDLKNISEKTLWQAIQPDDGEPLGSDW